VGYIRKTKRGGGEIGMRNVKESRSKESVRRKWGNGWRKGRGREGREIAPVVISKSRRRLSYEVLVYCCQPRVGVHFPRVAWLLITDSSRRLANSLVNNK